MARALDAGVAPSWVTGAAVYGNDTKLRRCLEARRQALVLVAACAQRLWCSSADGGMEQQRVDGLARELSPGAWKRISVGHGAKGERLYDWALLGFANQAKWEKALLVRRSREDASAYAYYLTYAPAHISDLEMLVPRPCDFVIEATHPSRKNKGAARMGHSSSHDPDSRIMRSRY